MRYMVSLNQQDSTKLEEERSVITYHPEEEVWYYFSKLTHLKYVIQQLKHRVNNRFFGLNTNAIMSTKTKLMAKKYIDTYTPLGDDTNLENNAEQITHTTRQAIEFYKASQTVSMYAKPILLYYCYRRLAHILFLATHESSYDKAERGSDTHGLKRDDLGNNIICKPAGIFARLQDSYYGNP